MELLYSLFGSLNITLTIQQQEIINAIVSSSSFIVLTAMLVEWFIPFPYLLRLNRLLPYFLSLSRRVNKLFYSQQQKKFAGILLPTLFIIPITIAIIALKTLLPSTGFIEFCILLFLFESKPPRTYAKKITYLLENDKNLEAKTILSSIVLRVTTKLSKMGVAKATCEAVPLRLLNNFYVIAVLYVLFGIYVAIIAKLFTLFAMSYNKKLAINEGFGNFSHIVCQALYVVPTIIMYLTISILPAPNKQFLKVALTHAMTTWPSKTTGMLLTSFAVFTNIQLGGPRYYMLNLYRFSTIGGVNQVETKDIKRITKTTSLYIWVTMIAICLIGFMITIYDYT
jgi:adenosylcobinamide-phosphate synthase